jgi:hypothetical protein
MADMLNNEDYEIKVKKFLLDDEVQKAEYLAILNDPECTVIDSKFAYDKFKEHNAIITIWWREPKDDNS